jgi:hypothetical protein
LVSGYLLDSVLHRFVQRNRVPDSIDAFLAQLPRLFRVNISSP